MESKMPFYYSLMVLVYEKLCKKYSLDNKGVLIKNTRIKEIF
jgi:hypothetical protein